MRRKRYLYHVTKPENVGSIIKDGLRVSMGDHTSFCVYLSENPLSWYQPGLDILRVDISGLQDILATTFLPESDEVIFWGNIPAWKLTKGGFKQRIELVTHKYVKKYSRPFSGRYENGKKGKENE